MLKNFKFFSPVTVDEALSLISENSNVKVLAGGTDLVIALRHKKVTPDVVVNVKSIPEMIKIDCGGEHVVIGGAASFSNIAGKEELNRTSKVLVQACNEVGSPQIRSLGTVGGNIANASPAADAVPALIALGAELVVEKKGQVRTLPLETFFVGLSQTVLEADELITEIRYPKPNALTASSFRKLGRRRALAIARISISAVIEKYPGENRIKNAKIALGAVNKFPFRAVKAEEALIGQEINEETKKQCVEKIAELAAETLGNRASATFKKESIKGVANDALSQVFAELSNL